MEDNILKEIEKLVFAIANDGKLNGISTPQKPWVDQIQALVEQQVLIGRIEELEALDEELYDDGRVFWGDPTAESEKESGKNHADLALHTRYLHQTIANRQTTLKAKLKDIE